MIVSYTVFVGVVHGEEGEGGFFRSLGSELSILGQLGACTLSSSPKPTYPTKGRTRLPEYSIPSAPRPWLYQLQPKG